MRNVIKSPLAGRSGLLLMLLAVAHLVGAGPPGLEAQEPEPIPVQEVRADGLSPELDSLFDEFTVTIRDSVAAHEVPGLSIAVVDRDRLLWAAGFGVRDRETGEPVTPETAFSVQSISKLFTAVAALRAVEEGILDLDAPVTDYLPDFTVNSRFSERPASRMTVRDLLTHAAGFTHEAPVGNNTDARSPSMEAHVESIRDTWLKFPPGTDHAYSNLGVDLAGYILQERSGRAFQDYVDEEILDPLGMHASFVDTAGQRLCSNCAAGHDEDFASLPTSVPMTASGGVRISAEDGGKFLQFLLRFGETPEGNPILERSSFDILYRPTGRFRDRWPHMWNGMGVWVHAHDEERNLMRFNGGGFGYIASIRWFPEQGVGALVLTNSSDHRQFGDDLTHSVLEGVVARGSAGSGEAPDVPTVRSFFADLPDTVATEAQEAGWAEPTPYRAELDEYLGTYEVVFDGGFELSPSADRAVFRVEVLKKDGYLQLRPPGSEEPEPLIEHEPGLFFGAESGEALDFRDDPPTWRNIELKRVRAAAASVQGAPESVPPDLASLSDSVGALVGNEGLPGAAVALVLPGGEIWSRGYGVADRSTGRPVTDSTLFRIGSTSKMLVGVAALQQRERGHLELDDPLRELAPGLPFDNPWAGERPVRLVHVLEHTVAVRGGRTSTVSYCQRGPSDRNDESEDPLR